MKWLKKYVLPAIIAVTVPITANAQAPVPTFTAGDLTVNGHDTNYEFGVVIDPDGGATIATGVNNTIGYWNGSGYTRLAGPVEDQTVGKAYQFGNVTATSTKNTPGSTGAVFTTDTTGYFTFGDVSATGGTDVDPTLAGVTDADNYEVYGIAVDNVTDYTGTLNANKITVVGGKKDGVFNTTSFGVGFLAADDGWGKVSGEVNIDSIEISSNQATGFLAGSIADGANVNIGEITLNTTGWAMGVEIAKENSGTPGAIGNITGGTFNVDKITATSTEADAVGIRADGGFATGAEAKVGAITVSGKTGASGIIAENDDGNIPASLAGLTLTDNIIVTTEDSTPIAYGIKAESVVATIANTGKEIEITTNGTGVGVQTTGAAGTTMKFEDGAQLYIDYVDVGNGLLAADGKGTGKIGGLYKTGGDYKLTGGVNIAVNYDASTMSTAPGSLYLKDGSVVTFNSEFADADGASDLADDVALMLDGTESNGVANIRTNERIYQINGDGDIRDLGVGLSKGFVAAANMHQRYSAWNATRDHMISAGSNRRGFLGQECDPCDPICDTNPCDPCDPCGKFGFGGAIGGAERSLARNAWVNYVGRAEEYDLSVNGKWKLGMDGVQIGTDLYKTNRNQLGVIFGYEGGDLYNTGDRSRIEGDDMYVGFYGAHVFNNGFDLRGTFAYGWQDYKMVRDNLTGTALFGSKFDGNTTESTVEIGKRFFNGNWSMRPVIGLDVLSNELDKAQEYDAAGNAAGYAYGKTDFTQVFLRAGTDLRWQLRRLTFNSGIYYSYDVDGDRLLATATPVAGNAITLAGSDMGRELLTFNVGGEYQFNHFSVFGGYQGQAVLDTDSNAYQSIGYVGGAWKW